MDDVLPLSKHDTSKPACLRLDWKATIGDLSNVYEAEEEEEDKQSNCES